MFRFGILSCAPHRDGSPGCLGLEFPRRTYFAINSSLSPSLSVRAHIQTDRQTSSTLVSLVSSPIHPSRRNGRRRRSLANAMVPKALGPRAALSVATRVIPLKLSRRFAPVDHIGLAAPCLWKGHGSIYRTKITDLLYISGAAVSTPHTA